MEEIQNTETREKALEGAVMQLTAMTENLQDSLAAMEQRLNGGNSGQVDAMTATVESVAPQQVEALEARLVEAERQIAVLQAGAAAMQAAGAAAPQPGRKTAGASATQLLAKHGMGEGSAVESGAVDAALVSLPIEQRIAVKSQLLRAGLLG